MRNVENASTKVDGADSEKGGLEIRPGMLGRLAHGKLVEGNQKFESMRPGKVGR